jgi:tripartite-type tricarboxylate transporter receptor subunit TctC
MQARRRTLVKALGALAASPLSRVAAGQVTARYPSRPVRVVVPYPAGTPLDVLMRVLGQHLSTRLGQPIVIDNKAGASSNIGTEFVARAPADGYTLLAYGINFTANPSLFRTVPYDAQKDFVPVAGLIRTPSVVIVPADSPFRTVADIVARAKEKPGALTYSSGGNGSMAHLCGELFKAGFGIDVLHTPYKGSPEVFASLLGKQTDYSMPVFNSALTQIKAGAFRGLAVTSPRRMPQLPDAPTMYEVMPPSGAFDLEAENGIVAPAGTPADVVTALSQHVAAILAEPDVAGPLVASGFEIASGTPAELGARIAKDLAKYPDVVRKAHARVD